MNARTHTPDRVNEDGSRTIHMKRACNGCGEYVGDVNDAELDAAVEDRALPDVRSECTNCAPVVALEQRGCRTWQLTPHSYLTVDRDLDRLNVFAKDFTEYDDEGVLRTIGLRVGIKPGHVVALYGDWLIRHPDGGFTVHAAPTAGGQR